MSAYQHDTHFTLTEARKLLPWVRERIEKITELFEILRDKGFDIVNKSWTPKGNGHSDGPPPDEYEEFIRLIAELDQRGVMIKNFRQGVVDFPHIDSNGDEVYLCWMLGEETISFRHTIFDGFMGRIPVEEGE